jgi:hypothetical protein
MSEGFFERLLTGFEHFLGEAIHEEMQLIAFD